MIKYVFGGKVKNITKEEDVYRIELRFGRQDTIIFWLDEMPETIYKGKKISVAGQQLKIDRENPHIGYIS